MLAMLNPAEPSILAITKMNNPFNLAGAERSCEVYSKESDNQYITNYRIIN